MCNLSRQHSCMYIEVMNKNVNPISGGVTYLKFDMLDDKLYQELCTLAILIHI